MKPSQMKLWARKAFKKRYGYAKVYIDAKGCITARYDIEDKALPLIIGQLKDCYLSETAEGIRFSHFGNLVWLFKHNEVTP